MPISFRFAVPVGSLLGLLPRIVSRVHTARPAAARSRPAVRGCDPTRPRRGGTGQRGWAGRRGGLKLPDAPSDGRTRGALRFHRSCSRLVTLARWSRGMITYPEWIGCRSTRRRGPLRRRGRSWRACLHDADDGTVAEGCGFPVAPYRGVEAIRPGRTTRGGQSSGGGSDGTLRPDNV